MYQSMDLASYDACHVCYMSCYLQVWSQQLRVWSVHQACSGSPVQHILVITFCYFVCYMTCRSGPNSCEYGQFTGPVWGHLNLRNTTMDWFLK
jgi:hypothetical protein